MTLEEKVEIFIKELENNIQENIPKVQNQFLIDYGWSEFDPLREEISRCLICDFCQAAITLTNHLLENFLKTMLIYNDKSCIDKTQDIRKSFNAGIEKYNDKNLIETIGYAKRLGIISKEDSQILIKYKDDFRNAYSHADKKKIFKDLKLPTQEISLNKDLEYEIRASENSNLFELLFAHGFAQALLSKKTAFEYFIKVDEIIRSSLKKFEN